MESASQGSVKHVGGKMVPLDDLSPHPLNANVMSDDLREKLRAHIKRTGRYPHLIVRPHPNKPGRYQVLDGHHRLTVLRDLGHATARCDIWDVDDREAPPDRSGRPVHSRSHDNPRPRRSTSAPAAPRGAARGWSTR